MIVVSDAATQPLRLGDHYHPGDESFVILAGGAELRTAPADDPTDVTQQRLVAGDTINIPPRTIHTFVCDPGTKLQSLTGTPFSDSWIVPAKLEFV